MEEIKFNRFVNLKGFPDGRSHQVRLVYDPNTKVVYMMANEIYHSGTVSLSPYYIVNDEGKAEIAVLGKNYFAG